MLWRSRSVSESLHRQLDGSFILRRTQLRSHAKTYYSVPLKIFAAYMSPLSSFSFLMLRSCRTHLGVTLLLRYALSTSSFTTFPATVRLRRHASTVPPSPADYARHETQKTASPAEELVGQSGCRYLIERVLQEKTIPPRRVYLARYVLLRLNCQHHLTCQLPLTQRRKPKVDLEGCLPVRLRVLSGHAPQLGQLSLSPPIARHGAGAVDVCL